MNDNSKKHHYRKVFKSDHLGVADLEDIIEEGKSTVFTIKQVKQEYGAKVAGKKIDCNIAYFVEPIKPMVLNATNSKVLKDFANGSPFVEDWSGLKIALYIDPNAKLKGDTVGGLRINPNKPEEKKELTPSDSDMWERAKNAFKQDGNLDRVLKHVSISEEFIAKLKEECVNV